jgi:hypothetical protein
MRILLLLLALALVAPVQGQGKPNQGLSTAETVNDNYRYLIAGNKEDLPRNRRYAETYRRKYFEARDAKHPRAKDYYNVAHYFNQLAETNAAILKILSGKDHSALDKQMQLIPQIEGRIMHITGRGIDRKWLTTEEMTDYIKAGIPYRSAANHVLPYAVKCWDSTQVQQHKNNQRSKRQPNRR